MKKHLTYQDAKSNKFWHIEQNGTEFTVTYGRTGTTGSSKTKTFSNEAEAQKEAEKLIAQKIKKGYVDINTASSAISSNTGESKEVVIVEPLHAQTTAAPTGKTLTLEADRKRSGGTKPVPVPQNKAEILTLIYNYKNLFAKKYTEDEFYQALSEGLLQAPKALFFEISAQKKKEYKKLAQLHLQNHADHYMQPFAEDILTSTNMIYIDKKVANNAFITKQLKKQNITVTTKLTDTTTHAAWIPGVAHRENIVYFDPNALNTYLKEGHAPQPSPYNDAQDKKIIELLTSSNSQSIDLGLSLLKALESINESLFVAMLAGYYFKINIKTPFKKNEKAFIKQTIESKVQDNLVVEENPIKILLKADSYADIIGVLAGHNIDPDLLIRDYYGAKLKNNRAHITNLNVFPYLSKHPILIKEIKHLSFHNEIGGRVHLEALIPHLEKFSALESITTLYARKSAYYNYNGISYVFANPGQPSTIREVEMAFDDKAITNDVIEQAINHLVAYPLLESLTIKSVGEHTIRKMSDKFIPKLNNVLRKLPKCKELQIQDLQTSINLKELLEGTCVEAISFGGYFINKITYPSDFSHPLTTALFEHSYKLDLSMINQHALTRFYLPYTEASKQTINLKTKKATVSTVFNLSYFQEVEELTILGWYGIEPFQYSAHQPKRTLSIKKLKLVGLDFNPEQFDLIEGVEELTLNASPRDTDKTIQMLPLHNWKLTTIKKRQKYDPNVEKHNWKIIENETIEKGLVDEVTLTRKETPDEIRTIIKKLLGKNQ